MDNKNKKNKKIELNETAEYFYAYLRAVGRKQNKSELLVMSAMIQMIDDLAEIRAYIEARDKRWKEEYDKKDMIDWRDEKNALMPDRK